MERFIVGTGRCGSTLLSRMLREHGRVLSIFELFNGIDAARRFAPEPVTGKQIAALLSAEQPFVTAVLRRGYEVDEIVYPFGSAGARYRRDEPLPWVLVSLIPRLTQEPDALYDALMDHAAALPTQSAPDHYRALFTWLGEQTGRPLWIERSGSSIEYLRDLVAAFPRARFLHLHRDGPETALSMRGHHAYRLPISLLYQAPLDSGRTASELGPIDLVARPTETDPISQILASLPPAEYFGRYWNDQILRGFRALADLDADQYLAMRFEDLVADPAARLAEIERFFDLEGDPGWIRRSTALVRGAPDLRAPALPPAEREALEAACRPGMLLLDRA